MNTPSSSRRLLALWLCRLATDRIALTRTSAPAEALVAARMVKSALRIAAVNAAAARLGLAVGLSIADARARHPTLTVVDDDPAADRALLEAIAEDCDRYTPLVALDPPDGVVLDIAGCAHLFGGEAALAGAVAARLAARGFAVRLAVADTPAGAWAMARYGRQDAATVIPGKAASAAETRKPAQDCDSGRTSGFRVRAAGASRHDQAIVLVPPGGLADALPPLPLAALRLSSVTVDALAAVGLQRIADVIPLPRATLTARFGEELLSRLDQAFGRAEAPIMPRQPAPSCVVERRFAEPVLLEEEVRAAIARLGERLGGMLEERQDGARELEVVLFRTDGKVFRIRVGAGAPVREPDRIIRLFADRLAAVGEACDPGFGYDLIRLSALVTERREAVQSGLDASDHAAELDHLVDRLGARFGPRRVTRQVIRDTHVPEFAVAAVPAAAMRDAQALPRTLITSPLVGEVDHRRLAGGDRERGVVKASARKVTPLPVPSPVAALAATKGGREQSGVRPSLRPSPGGEEGTGCMPAAFAAQDTLVPSRPVRLFERPEPIEALAEVPDGPPVRFRWRRVLHEVAAAEGPERIALPWWHDADGHALTRDYFRVETRQGVRVWLFREGLFGRETASPHWFLHGLFG